MMYNKDLLKDVESFGKMTQRKLKQVFKIRDRSIEKQICSWCEGNAHNFKDKLSEEEYLIGGLCQQCQDQVFIEEEENKNLHVRNGGLLQ